MDLKKKKTKGVDLRARCFVDNYMRRGLENSVKNKTVNAILKKLSNKAKLKQNYYANYLIIGKESTARF